eukprot:CAMPEP_0181171706 /NCGR_PEP_ID=MMETSP1096-20121128/2058_1 /TAXON_ID=156174 ORGANISM="Chrysochromulina ericina, Strain CCMP281" /NCGR_SAMPLE_ID=MMETSP1096 /ASSEMBLY_ACC=CAM_ASM_000453 /LENGTH=106 /DNA_ID=CAMNT_0023259383 /DNA_START=627 /DNA_END=948 /DNA_ORIENTATION=-
MSARRITFFVVPIRELGIHQPNPGAIEIKADAVVANIIVRVEDVEKVVPLDAFDRIAQDRHGVVVPFVVKPGYAKRKPEATWPSQPEEYQELCPMQLPKSPFALGM